MVLKYDYVIELIISFDNKDREELILFCIVHNSGHLFSHLSCLNCFTFLFSESFMACSEV